MASSLDSPVKSEENGVVEVLFTFCYYIGVLKFINIMKLTCPECKNDVDLASYTDLAKDQVIECGMCGISLVVTNVDGDTVEAEITDEGK